ncbi:hypothetical protein OC846_006642, partial [Tilletia horrida]
MAHPDDPSKLSDEDLALHLDTTMDRIRHYAQGVRHIEYEIVLSSLQHAEKVHTDDFFLSFNNPTTLLARGYRGTPAPVQNAAGSRYPRPQNDYASEVEEYFRKQDWEETSLKILRSLLDRAVFSVSRETAQDGIGEVAPAADADLEKWFRDRLEENNPSHPDATKKDGIRKEESQYLDDPKAVDAWEAIFEDQLELARSQLAVWVQGFDTLLLFVGLLSAVIANFVTTYDPKTVTHKTQATTAGYRLSLFLTLVAGVIALRMRAILTRLN